jgi:hypothetical protein
MLFDLYKADQLNDTHIATFNSKKELLYDILNQSSDHALKEAYSAFLRGVESSFIKHTYSLRVQIELVFLSVLILLIFLLNNRELLKNNILKLVKIILVVWYFLFSFVVIFDLIYNNDCMEVMLSMEHRKPDYSVYSIISSSNNEILKKEYDYFLLDMRDNYTVYSRSLEKQVLVFYLFLVLFFLLFPYKKIYFFIINKINKDYIDFKKDRYI